MNDRYLFAPRRDRLATKPGSMILKLVLGEAPDGVPTTLDVRSGAVEAASKFTIGSVDRIMRRFANNVRICRVHTAVASYGRPGHGHKRFDDVEHAVGLSRTFRIESAQPDRIDDLVDAMRQLAVVEHASPHYLCELPFVADEPGDRLDDERAWRSRLQVRAVEALAYEPGDPAVVVAVIDTGVRYDHPELYGRLRSGFDTVQLGGGLGGGMSLVGDASGIDTDPDDEVGHGTSCAGIIGANGTALPPGLAGACSVLPIRVLGAAKVQGRRNRVGVGALGDIDEGVKRAIDLGAKVLNMSFGTPASALDSGDPTPHADVVRYGVARGCIMVAASGNSGKTEDYSPARLDGVIAVGACDDDDRPASFTTRGRHVALSAPGDRVLSAGMNGYATQTGTSFAAPFVAAAAALLVSRAARRSYPLTGADVRRILASTARPWPGAGANGCGAGVLDAHAALLALDREIDGADTHAEPVLSETSARQAELALSY
jgi:subtilisin family serine protease